VLGVLHDAQVWLPPAFIFREVSFSMTTVSTGFLLQGKTTSTRDKHRARPTLEPERRKEHFMNRLCVCTALALLVAAGSGALVEGRGRKAQGIVSGRVAALNQGSITIAKKKQGSKRRPQTYVLALTPQTTVILPNGQPAPPNSLQLGVRVRIAVQMGTGGPVATQIRLLGR
jgi:hypothetical protein